MGKSMPTLPDGFGPDGKRIGDIIAEVLAFGPPLTDEQWVQIADLLRREVGSDA